jgi:hypothetical protein
MKFLIVLLFSLSARASVPELFGSSAGSIAIGNQAEANSAANNFYAPALLGYSRKTMFSFNSFYINANFTPISDVIVKNESNTVGEYESGSVEVNPTPTTMFGAHLSVPLFADEGPKFNISIFAPFDRLMEADTGDPYRPRYVMYENRFIRPVLIFSGAQDFGNWSFSLGAQTGFQSNGETFFVTRTTTGNPSVAKVSFNAKPSIGFVGSVAKKNGAHTTYLTVQQEMKSKLQNRATGETEIASNSSFQFDFDVASLLYYDPLTLRLGHQIEMTQTNWFFSLEYQDWFNYEASTMKIKKRGGGINGSTDYEKLSMRNIFIPKVGVEKKLADHWIGKMGYFYRPSPIYSNNLKNAGNTIDVDKHVGSLGLAHIFKVYQKDITLDLAYQLHLLRQMKINKTPGREDGDPGEEKIGSPGYRIGGMIHVLSLGLSWMY